MTDAAFSNRRDRYAALGFDALAISVAVIDHDGWIVAVNRAWRRFAQDNGAADPESAFIGVNYLEVCQTALESGSEVDAGDAGEALAGLRDVLRGDKQEFELAYPCHSPDHRRWFRMLATPIDGRRTGAIVFHEDISREVHAEESRRASRRWLEFSLDAGEIALWELSEDSRCLHGCERFVRLFGFNSSDASTGLPVATLSGRIHREDRGDLRRALNPGPELQEVEIRVIQESETRWIRLRSRLEANSRDGGYCVAGVAYDTTEGHFAESDRQRAYAMIKGIFDASPAAMFIKDQNLTHLQLSRSCEKLFNRPVSELVGKTNEQLFPRETAERLSSLDRTALETDHVTHAISEVELPSGIQTFAEYRFPIRGVQGEQLALGGIAINITDRLLTERQLRDVEARHRMFFDSAPIGFFELEPDAELRIINPAGSEVLGLSSAHDLVGVSLRKFVQESDWNIFQRALERVLDAQPTVIEVGLENGRKVRFTMGPIHDASGAVEGIIGSMQDFTRRWRRQRERERVRLDQDQIRNAERQRISREIHDELGQTLSILKSDLRNLEQRIVPNEAGPLDQGELEDRIVQVSELVDQVIGSARRVAINLRAPELDELGLLEALKRECDQVAIRSQIACEFVIEDSLPALRPVSEFATFRVGKELLVNAERHSRADKIEVRLAMDRERLRLEVCDDGVGIDPDQVGQRGRLGLIGARERLSELGGQLRLETSKSGGALAVAEIPASEAIDDSTEDDFNC